MNKIKILLPILIFILSAKISAQTPLNADSFVHDTEVFERGYWEARLDNDIYIIRFKKVNIDWAKVLPIEPTPKYNNFLMTSIFGSYKHIKDGEVVEDIPIGQLGGAIKSGEYKIKNRIEATYHNEIIKERGDIIFQIDENNPDKMTWTYTKKKREIPLLDPFPEFNRGEQKTPSYLTFYRKEEEKSSHFSNNNKENKN